MNQNIAKWIIIAGVVLIGIGIIYYFAGDKLKWIGNLPGDFRIKKDNFNIYFPLTTMIILSIVLNVVIRLINYLK